ncbi:MAG: DUF6268 family outer membrane beta-barrel protein [Maioricimonas sp. JB045]|uniref:DUF6268 family outer membrane beta-barrel protein n=1 Tax=Maioricimonas sp. JC845 TaxID=3232138 RepID=UPI003458E03D
MGWPLRPLLAVLVVLHSSHVVIAQSSIPQQTSSAETWQRPVSGDGWNSFGHAQRTAATNASLPDVAPVSGQTDSVGAEHSLGTWSDTPAPQQAAFGAPVVTGGPQPIAGDIVPTQYPLDDETDEGPAPFVPPVPPPHARFGPVDDGWMGMSLKSSNVNATYLSGKGNTLGITSLDFRGTIQSAKLRGIFATPRFSWHFLDGPASTDLPGQLYNLSVDFLMVRPIGRNWMLHLAIAPGLNTDFNNVSSDSLRIMGRGLAFYNWSPALQLVGGVVYLDRDDIPLLPAAGLVYTPNEDTKIEVMFPRPRVARRYVVTPDHERWIYLAGELGGGTWAVERTSGRDDEATYRDLRLLFGVEHKWHAGPTLFFEGGYVFDRELEYESNIGNRTFTDTVMVRVGANF